MVCKIRKLKEEEESFVCNKAKKILHCRYGFVSKVFYSFQNPQDVV